MSKFFFVKHVGIYLRTECWTSKKLAILTKPLILKLQSRYTQKEQGVINLEKGHEQNNAPIEIKRKGEGKKSYQLTHPAKDSINFHPHLNQN